MVGEQIGHYRILSRIGAGGMGVVWGAEDLTLNRRVALKFIRDDLGTAGSAAETRLVREARAASALDHPNVATIYEVGEWQGRHFIAMAWYDGETLAARVARGALPLDDAVDLLTQIADGLTRAHAAGIVHRDLKPGNVLITRDGVAKILDFGLAAYSAPEAATEPRLTATGSTMGTIAYMAPEQAIGSTVDARADIWALGVIGFELLSGRLPFRGEHTPALLHSIQYDAPADLHALRPEVPAPLRSLLGRALEKKPAERLASAAEFATGLRAIGRAASPVSGRPRRVGRGWLVAAAAIVVIVGGGLVWSGVARQRRAEWARDVALPGAAKFADDEQFVDAFDLAVRAEAVIPENPTLTALVASLSRTLNVRSDPPGATVSYRDYQAPRSEWRIVGVTPIDNVRVPAAYLTWRLEKPGFETIEMPRWMGSPGAFPDTRVIDAELRPAADAPPGMVFVPSAPAAGRVFLPGLDHVSRADTIPAFWIDRHEVTNAEFKKFVDAGGYRRRELWPESFVDGGVAIPWDTAMAKFVDATGRPGPATWMQAEYPTGESQHPVTGVSWFEAAAYARFAGKQLPTIHHWSLAAEPRAARWVVPFSNFGGQGPAAAGARPALHASGAYDMAGNVKEWSSTEAGDGRRYLLGGAWDEPGYTFNDPDARSPFDRGKTFGFRCVLYRTPPDAALLMPLPWSSRDYSRERPASDQEFAIYRRQYAYDHRPFDATVATISGDHPDWRREDVTVPAAYGGERMRIFLLLPRRQTAPYPTVVFWPGSNAVSIRDFAQFPMARFEFLLKSGRAVAVPEFKGTFGRPTELQDTTANASATYRDHVIAWIRDFSRTVDYLATRRDLSIDRLSMLGVSWGGKMGAIVPAIDDRLKAMVLVSGGFAMQQPLPEVDQKNFASRIAIPVLMLNGVHDFFFPAKTSQAPMFEAFKTPKDQKRHQHYEGGHGIPQAALIRETLDWLDRFQPVTDAAGPATIRR